MHGFRWLLSRRPVFPDLPPPRDTLPRFGRPYPFPFAGRFPLAEPCASLFACTTPPVRVDYLRGGADIGSSDLRDFAERNRALVPEPPHGFFAPAQPESVVDGWLRLFRCTRNMTFGELDVRRNMGRENTTDTAERLAFGLREDDARRVAERFWMVVGTLHGIEAAVAGMPEACEARFIEAAKRRHGFGHDSVECASAVACAGHALLRMGFPAHAARHLGDAWRRLGACGGDGESWSRTLAFDIAECLASLGRPDEAREFADAGRGEWPARPVVRSLLGMCGVPSPPAAPSRRIRPAERPGYWPMPEEFPLSDLRGEDLPDRACGETLAHTLVFAMNWRRMSVPWPAPPDGPRGWPDPLRGFANWRNWFEKALAGLDGSRFLLVAKDAADAAGVCGDYAREVPCLRFHMVPAALFHGYAAGLVGYGEEAREVFGNAARLARDLFGDRHPETARARSAHAFAERALGEHANAAARLASALDALDGGARSARHAERGILLNLAGALDALGRNDDAARARHRANLLPAEAPPPAGKARPLPWEPRRVEPPDRPGCDEPAPPPTGDASPLDL